MPARRRGPQGSLALWHSKREDRQPPLESAARGIDRLLAHAMIEGREWVFIDTAPTLWVVVQERSAPRRSW